MSEMIVSDIHDILVDRKQKLIQLDVDGIIGTMYVLDEKMTQKRFDKLYKELASNHNIKPTLMTLVKEEV